MKQYLTPLTLLLTFSLWLPTIGSAQTRYEITDDTETSIRVLGTSTLHAWEMETNTATGIAEFVFTSGKEPTLVSLKQLTFALRVKDLKSNNKGLDKNAYEALQADKYPTIQYQLSSATVSPEAGTYQLKTQGKLTIAGTTKDIQMDVDLIVNENGIVSCAGSYALKMTDYGVTPPSFMLGVMKTGDDLTLEFAVAYERSTGAK
ncbi:polyisoprenoid-binding protein YceI [Lewinella aquimaris]|uniref:Polyisoprenoid-binding protein YceI n=1 Tax=Neolewinella aquimaris TaxID=1835722 RepID=A0A840E5E5_9BACT|nr:YceI family protein [Neolewinella aquimaris]MBB4080864.1 polyisoprenoid-binding protein YceI [Neolewinella aquimaris]